MRVRNYPGLFFLAISNPSARLLRCCSENGDTPTFFQRLVIASARPRVYRAFSLRTSYDTQRRVQPRIYPGISRLRSDSWEAQFP
jgi:hypothetical protein